MSKQNEKSLKKSVKRKISSLLSQSPDKIFTPKQVAKAIGFHQPIQKKLVTRLLNEMYEDKILNAEGESYCIGSSYNSKEGIVEFTAKGSAYILLDDEDDIYISKEKTKNALDGDLVAYSLNENPNRRKPEGKIERVVKRKKTEFVGTLDISKKFAFVITDNRKVHIDFFIDLKHLGKAKDGDKVVVQLLNWPEKLNSPFGKIIKILGKSGDTDTEINAIMEDFELPYEFPAAVLQAAEDVDTTISDKEIAKRRDLERSTH